MQKASRNINKFIDQCVLIDPKTIKDQNNLVYMSRAFVYATLPHSRPLGNSFVKVNGDHTLTLTANPLFGLPYGSPPRLLLAGITRQAVITKKPEIHLGKTFERFISTLKYNHRSGGLRGDVARLREQFLKLLTTQISIVTLDRSKGKCKANQFIVTSAFDLWWNPLEARTKTFKFNSTITLSTDFFNNLRDKPIPLDLRALVALRKSPMQIDIYVWLTYKFSQINKTTKPISWIALQQQFGSGYPPTNQGKRDFKKNFLNALHPVRTLYHEANVEVEASGIILKPSPTHVRKVNVHD
jgi:hypothetical protein